MILSDREIWMEIRERLTDKWIAAMKRGDSKTMTHYQNELTRLEDWCS